MTPLNPTTHGRPATNPRSLRVMWVMVIAIIAPGAVLWGIDGWHVATGYIPHTRTANIYFTGD